MSTNENINTATPEPIDSPEAMEKAIRDAEAQEQLYSIALFDILGFSNFVQICNYNSRRSLTLRRLSQEILSYATLCQSCRRFDSNVPDLIVLLFYKMNAPRFK